MLYIPLPLPLSPSVRPTAPLFQKINSALTSSLGTDIMKGRI